MTPSGARIGWHWVQPGAKQKFGYSMGRRFILSSRPASTGGLNFRTKLRVERTEVVQLERLDNILDELVKDIDEPRIFSRSTLQDTTSK